MPGISVIAFEKSCGCFSDVNLCQFELHKTVPSAPLYQGARRQEDLNRPGTLQNHTETICIDSFYSVESEETSSFFCIYFFQYFGQTDTLHKLADFPPTAFERNKKKKHFEALHWIK